MMSLFMVGFFHDGGYEPMAFFVKKSDARSYLNSLLQNARYSSATLEEVTASMFEMVP